VPGDVLGVPADPADQPRRLFAELARVVDVPWDIAVGGDLAFPGVQGRRTVKVRLVNAYIARLHAAAARVAPAARHRPRCGARQPAPGGG
jgi:hypothetical protein